MWSVGFLLKVLSFYVIFNLLLCGDVFAVEEEIVDSVPNEMPPAHPSAPFTIDDMASDEDIFGDIFIQPYENDPIVEIGTKQILPRYAINAFRDDEVIFTTGLQRYITANIYWKWFAIGYSIPMQNYTNGFSFSFCPLISNFLFELNISKIRKYKSSNVVSLMLDEREEDDLEQIEEVMLDGLETFEWSLSSEWAFNKSIFSSSSLFSQSYSCGQRVSAGSLLAGAAVGQNSFKLNPDDSRSDTANAILSKLPMQDNRITNFSVGCGYGYNFVVRQGTFVVGAMLIPYVSGAFSHYKLEDDNVDQFCYGMRAHGRINCVYQYKYGFVSVSNDFHGLFFYDNRFTYYQSNLSLNINAAFKLGMLGVKHEKVPGHQFIDFVNNWF